MPAAASTNEIGSGLTREQAALIRDAFPTNDAGVPRCGHCGGPRKASLMLCFRCWRRLSEFVRAEILRAPLVEKAHLIVQTRPASTRVPSSTEEVAPASGGTRVAASENEGGTT